MKKKKLINPLSLWKMPCKKTYYLTHPFKWINDIYWNIRNFIHRGRYGFAYSDVWQWFWWWPTVGAEALRYMAENGHGYPTVAPWGTPEKWHRYLRYKASELDWCADTCDIAPDHHHYQNEFYQAMEEIRKRTNSNRALMTAQDEEIVKKYWNREEELSKADSEQCAKIFAEIGQNLGRFWD